MSAWIKPFEERIRRKVPGGSAHLPPLNVRNLQPSGCAFSSAFRRFVNGLRLPGRRLSRLLSLDGSRYSWKRSHDSSASLLVTPNLSTSVGV